MFSPHGGSRSGRRPEAGFLPFFRLVESVRRTADSDHVRAMRARLMMKLVSVSIMLVLSVITARSCSSSPPSSNLNPSTLEQNGLSGLCANQSAVAAATGDSSPQTLQVPPSDGGLSNLAAPAGLAGLAGGTFACPTTTTVAGGS